MNQINIDCTSSDDQNKFSNKPDIEFSLTNYKCETQFKVYFVPAKGLNLSILFSIEFINGTGLVSKQ